ncbi:ammonium transporter [Labrys wisconsinensis]|uniref:Ammonium transporter n=1 Tax=Labrys wisconsinensis TaxID=425677 RepID=A0ABU0JK65_9HYPH|nr:ammonium transporter [Labrys wisconsinensis]MDQ0474686.1 Amt family ammonium transporter [Labrys wisconsinensis]
MTFSRVLKYATPALLGALLAASPAWADAVADSLAAPGAKGDTAWMLTASALVLLMTVPGLALFYGGLVRSKNMLSVFTQVFVIAALVSVIWVVYGYSLTFTEGSGPLQPFFGGFSKLFLAGVSTSTGAATFTNGVYIPEFVYICFQMTFAMITPGLIVGSFAERIKFSSMIVFIVLWVTFIYFPMAHMVWYWGGPDAATAPAGQIFTWGALDFAGGTVVHINAGIAGLVGALVLGKRVGYGKEHLPPHSLTMTAIGGSLLWVGWFGFNAGSNLEATSAAALAMINTFVATAAAAVSWLFVEWSVKGKPSLLGTISGAVAGLVAVTPACGFSGPMGAVVLGLLVSPICFFFVSTVKNALGYDDSLDVFGVHCVGGIFGALATGILVNPALGGAGIADYVTSPGKLLIAEWSIGQVWIQAKGVLLTLAWSGIGSFILYKLVDLVMGLRVTNDQEREGLDIAEHGERAYNY